MTSHKPAVRTHLEPAARHRPAVAGGVDQKRNQDGKTLLRQFRALMQAARNQFVEAREQSGLTGAELWALAEVRRQPGIRVTELARIMSIHQTTASNLVMVLVRAGLATKQSSASDRRWVTLAVTTAGERVLSSTHGPHEGVLPAAIERLNDDQRVTLSAALEPLLAQLGISTLDPAGNTPLAEILDTGDRPRQLGGGR